MIAELFQVIIVDIDDPEFKNTLSIDKRDITKVRHQWQWHQKNW